MKYWHNITDTFGNTYSIDMIRINFELNENKVKDLKHYLNDITRPGIESYSPNFKQFKYKHLYLINYEFSSMSVGIGFNGFLRDDNFKGFIEFNPNKTMISPQCILDIIYIKQCSCTFELSRFDLAIDLSFSRECFRLLKDNRKYQLVKNSESDKTEYLGCRNKAGFVKLYNKTIESELDYDLTRLEITFDGNAPLYPQLQKFFPKVYIKSNQETLATDELTKTHFVILELLQQVQEPEIYLNSLDYRTREKLRKHLYFQDSLIEYDYTYIYELVKNLKEIVDISSLSV